MSLESGFSRFLLAIWDSWCCFRLSEGVNTGLSRIRAPSCAPKKEDKSICRVWGPLFMKPRPYTDSRDTLPKHQKLQQVVQGPQVVQDLCLLAEGATNVDP